MGTTRKNRIVLQCMLILSFPLLPITFALKQGNTFRSPAFPMHPVLLKSESPHVMSTSIGASGFYFPEDYQNRTLSPASPLILRLL